MPAPKKIAPEDFLALMGDEGKPRVCGVCQLAKDQIAAIDHAILAGRSAGAICRIARELWGLEISEGSFHGHKARHVKGK